MKGIIKKWGNSFAIRIPKVIMDDAHLKTDSEIDITITDGKILMSPTLPQEITLVSLIAQISNENVHHEVDTGPAIGNEVD